MVINCRSDQSSVPRLPNLAVPCDLLGTSVIESSVAILILARRAAQPRTDVSRLTRVWDRLGCADDFALNDGPTYICNAVKVANRCPDDEEREAAWNGPSNFRSSVARLWPGGRWSRSQRNGEVVC